MQHDLRIATDGAAHAAAALGFVPDLICGDFDSIELNFAREVFPDAKYVETPDQNLADLEKAILLARELGATEVTILGGEGGRIDHALATAALLLQFHDRLGIALRHDGSTIRAASGHRGVPGTLKVATRRGDTISLVAFSPANGVSLSGVAWPMEDERLSPGTHGVSNVALGDCVTVSIREGALLICHLYTE